MSGVLLQLQLLLLAGLLEAYIGAGLDGLLGDAGLVGWFLPFGVQRIPRLSDNVGLGTPGEDVLVFVVIVDERKKGMRRM